MAAPIDTDAAHRFFAPDCFNRCWGLIDRTDRERADDEQMLHLAHASLYHWSQRPDCTEQNRSIGCWQLARVYALVGRGAEARYWGERALAHAAHTPPFYRAYAHEALARAAAVLHDVDARYAQLVAARVLLEQITDAEERAMLEADLASVAPQ